MPSVVATVDIIELTDEELAPEKARFKNKQGHDRMQRQT